MKRIMDWKIMTVLSVGLLAACDTEEETLENDVEEELVEPEENEEPEELEEDEDIEDDEPEDDPDLEDEEELEDAGDSDAEEVLSEVSDNMETIESFSLETSQEQYLEDDEFYTDMTFEVTVDPPRIYGYGSEVDAEGNDVEAELYMDDVSLHVWREGQTAWDSYEESDGEDIVSALFEKEVGILLQYLDQVEFEEDNGLYVFNLALEHEDVQEVSYNIGELFLFHTQDRSYETVDTYELTFTVDADNYLPISSEELTEGEVSRGELSEHLFAEVISWDDIDEVEEPDDM